MRIRNNPRAKEILSASVFTEDNPFNVKGKWRQRFGNDNPIHVEIGMGKGDFVIGMAEKFPNINFIAIERFPTIILKALKKMEIKGIKNVVVIDIDADQLSNIFDDKEVTNIYLNFSDPWPKARHDKRRLTHKDKLDLYDKVLSDDGSLIFKTDNQALFEWSLESMSDYNMSLRNISVDLHNTKWHKDGDNVVTEYETKFSDMGFRINRVEAYFRGKK